MPADAPPPLGLCGQVAAAGIANNKEKKIMDSEDKNDPRVVGHLYAFGPDAFQNMEPSMRRNRKANCGNCPYWYRNVFTKDPGDCFRFPPVGGFKKSEDEEVWQVQPQTWSGAICGEHPNFFEKENDNADRV